jgi:antirestriction protein
MENGNEDRQPATESPRIYVACLASYNSGILHGAWIAADQAPDDIHAKIQSMLAKSKEPVAEEWAIHDYEGFHGRRLAEYESIETVAHIANLIAEHGQLGAELLAHCDDSPEAARAAISDGYQGAFDSPAHWAEQLLEDCGDLAQIPERLRGYFDFESYARDAELSGDIFVIEIDRQHHVFWSR